MTKYFNRSEFKELRKGLRNNPTRTEKILWDCLKGKKLNGFKFRRQYGVGSYSIDFYCVEKKLAVEIDGDIHNEKENIKRDKERSEYIDQFGIRIIRFTNEEVEKDVDGVLRKILNELTIN